MIEDIFSRSKMLMGNDAFDKLSKSHVAVFGLGGVGSYVVEALARAGLGKISIFDGDVVNQSNINRQLLALHSTLGKKKVQVCTNRLLDINPNIKVYGHDIFYTAENQMDFDFKKYDYIVDAIDMISSKILIIFSTWRQRNERKRRKGQGSPNAAQNAEAVELA